MQSWRLFCRRFSKNSSLHNPPPLDGIRVIDLTRILDSADIRADVIKIEEPTKGDDTRAWGPPYAKSKVPNTKDESAYFLAVNRNKRSLALNIKSKEGKDIIRDLVKSSDVLIENYVPGKLDSMGLGYDELQRLNPRLVYASISGYGPTGPYAQDPGYDVIIEAEAGLMHITGEESGEPVKVGVAITDLTTGLYCHGSILAALFARERTGKGQKIDVSLLESQVASLANIASNYLIGGQEATRQGTAHASIVPYQLFQTRDGKIVFGAGNDKQFKKLCEVMEMSNLSKDEKFSNNSNRVKNRDELIGVIQTRLLEHSSSHWLDKIRQVGIPCGPVNNIEQTFQHEQVIHRQMVVEVDHLTCGRVKLVGIPSDYSETPPRIRLAPPVHGQHSREILANVLGYSDETIRELIQLQIINQPNLTLTKSTVTNQTRE